MNCVFPYGACYVTQVENRACARSLLFFTYIGFVTFSFNILFIRLINAALWPSVKQFCLFFVLRIEVSSVTVTELNPGGLVFHA